MAASEHPSMPVPEWNIRNGACFVLFAYDVARSINLERAERRLSEASQRKTMPRRRRAPSYFEFQPPPLRVTRDCEPLGVGGFALRPSVELIAFDFGAVVAVYTLALEGPLAELLQLSEDLYDNEALIADSRRRVEQFVEVIGDAAAQVDLAPLVEDYAIYHIESFVRPFDARRLRAECGSLIARVLRAERQALSEQEVEDALGANISYGAEDLAIVDWNAALLVDREGEDVRTVLEFVNVQLLEMRFLDQRLDRALDEAYETLSRRPSGMPKVPGYYRAALRRVSELQVDNAVLFEGVNNTLKLLGDQYLARLYRIVSRRFHLDEWDASILRKIQTLESIYEKISDQAATQRMEVLEWVIIVLIAFSIGVELFR